MKTTHLQKLALLGLGLSTLMTAHAQATTHSPAMRSEITTAISHEGATDLLSTPIKGLPTPALSINQVDNIATVLIPATSKGNVLLDTTLMDEFIDDVSPNARHYPTNFPNQTANYIATQNAKHLSDWIEPYANAKDATFEVVIRAAKLNGIARNLNAGSEYTSRANTHMAKAVKMKPNDAEANFLIGMMLAEAGGFKEGKKYLDKAASLGYMEAEQSLAQADLLADKQKDALARLKRLQAKHPDNAQLAQQIKIIEDGGYYIWKIEDNNLNIKPVQ